MFGVKAAVRSYLALWVSTARIHYVFNLGLIFVWYTFRDLLLLLFCFQPYTQFCEDPWFTMLWTKMLLVRHSEGTLDESLKFEVRCDVWEPLAFPAEPSVKPSGTLNSELLMYCKSL